MSQSWSISSDSKIFVYLTAVYMNFSDSKKTHLMNLLMTIKMLSYWYKNEIDKISMKFMIIMWNKINSIVIDCNNS